MNSLTRNLNILWRSERLIAEAEWRRSSRQITILVLAGVFGLLALIMLNVAAFYWLSASYGNAPAALAVAVADLVVAAILMSMGMMMVPPVIVSLPFKLAFFVVADGWSLVSGALVRSYF